MWLIGKNLNWANGELQARVPGQRSDGCRSPCFDRLAMTSSSSQTSRGCENCVHGFPTQRSRYGVHAVGVK